MTITPSQQAELRDLIDAVCEAEPTSPTIEQLEALLLADDDACRYYLDYACLHGALMLAAQPHASEERPEANKNGRTTNDARDLGDSVPSGAGIAFPIPEFSIQHSSLFGDVLFSYVIAAVILGVGLVVGAFVYVSQPVQVVRQSAPLHSPPSTTHSTVGRITGMVDCKWQKTGTDPIGAKHPQGRSGQWGLSPFSPGNLPSPSGRGAGGEGSLQLQSPVYLHDQFALSSGLLEITYDTGAKVILQGPVTYEVESPAGGYLSIGKLTARLEKSSEVRVQESEASNHKSEILNHKFVVRTPTATVTDLGTEFGVEVQDSGDTSAHVFHGVVEVKPAAVDGKQDGQAVRLIENESAQVQKSSNDEPITVQRGKADPSAFVRSEQLPKLAEESRLTPFRRWQTYSMELRKDPSLLAYYDFQQRRGEPAVLPNVADNGNKSLDGVIQQAAWTTGRMPGKQALYFDGSQARVKVNLPQRMTQMTLAAWIAIELISDGPESPGTGLLMSDGWVSGENFGEKCHWQINRDGDICCGTPTTPRINTARVLPWTAWGRQRWYHLVVVGDPAQRRLTCYLNGRSIFEGALCADFAATFGSAQIGNWQPSAGHKERPFCGRMDELLVLSRAMTNEEIQEMYTAGAK